MQAQNRNTKHAEKIRLKILNKSLLFGFIIELKILMHLHFSIKYIAADFVDNILITRRPGINFFGVFQKHLAGFFISILFISKFSYGENTDLTIKQRIIINQSKHACGFAGNILQIAKNGHSIFGCRLAIAAFCDRAERIYEISVINKIRHSVIRENVGEIYTFRLLIVRSHINKSRNQLRAFARRKHTLSRHSSSKLFRLFAVFINMSQSTKILQKIKIHFLFSLINYLHYIIKFKLC